MRNFTRGPAYYGIYNTRHAIYSPKVLNSNAPEQDLVDAWFMNSTTSLFSFEPRIHYLNKKPFEKWFYIGKTLIKRGKNIEIVDPEIG